jgi:outer membrane protein assembly factor BamD
MKAENANRMKTVAELKSFLFLAAVLAVVALVVPACAGKKDKRASAGGPHAGVGNAELYHQAMRGMRRKNTIRSRAMLEEILNRPMDLRYTPLAQLRIADSYFREGGIEGWSEGVIQYRKFLRSYPRHEKADYAQYQVAMCYYKMIENPYRDTGNTQFSVDEFQKLIRLYPESIHVRPAKQRIRECRLLLAEAEFRVGRFYYSQSNYQAALGRFETILKEYSTDYQKAEFYYYTGDSYWLLGRKEEGAKYLNMAIERAPSSEYAQMAQARLGGKPSHRGFWKRILPPYGEK